MPVITTDDQGRIILPDSFLNRRHIPVNMEYWLDERDGELILHPRQPNTRKLYIEPTTRCNLNCVTCIRNAWHDPQEHMTWETFTRILDSLDRLPELNRVVFTSFGEPLFHPRILDMVAAIRQRNISVTVGSNGLLLRPEISGELIKLGVDRLVVSVDGVKPETYKNVRGASLLRVLENIHAFNEQKIKLSSLTPELGIEFVLLRSNAAELPELTRLASKLGASRVIVTNVLPYTDEMRDQVLYGHEPQEPFKSGGFPVYLDAWVTWGTIEMPRMHWGAERRCRFIKDRAMVVCWDGSVSPCYALSHKYSYLAIDGRKKDVEQYILGNVVQNNLADIWMSEDYVRFRSEVRMFHFPSCPDCDLRSHCEMRGHNEGCWGWNPSCADCLWAQDIIRCP